MRKKARLPKTSPAAPIEAAVRYGARGGSTRTTARTPTAITAPVRSLCSIRLRSFLRATAGCAESAVSAIATMPRPKSANCTARLLTARPTPKAANSSNERTLAATIAAPNAAPAPIALPPTTIRLAFIRGLAANLCASFVSALTAAGSTGGGRLSSTGQGRRSLRRLPRASLAGSRGRRRGPSPDAEVHREQEPPCQGEDLGLERGVDRVVEREAEAGGGDACRPGLDRPPGRHAEDDGGPDQEAAGQQHADRAGLDQQLQVVALDRDYGRCVVDQLLGVAGRGGSAADRLLHRRRVAVDLEALVERFPAQLVPLVLARVEAGGDACPRGPRRAPS